jgi:hypothetical protein
LIWKNNLSLAGKELQTTYVKNKKISLATTPITKIVHKTFLPELKSYLSGMINVLLYDLTMNYSRREITCDGGCLLAVDKNIVKKKSVVLESYDNFLYLESGENSITPKQVIISSLSGSLVTVTSYKRASYGGMPRNTFR